MHNTQTDFYLLIDHSIICSYLASKWITAYQDLPNFQGILIKDHEHPQAVLKQRQDFHDRFFSKDEQTPDLWKTCEHFYPDMDHTERAMIQNFGVSRYASTSCSKTHFLGHNLNSSSVQEWLTNIANDHPPIIFVCATQILKSWWIELTASRLFNCHSAVLPYARGMYAIENMAAQRDIEQFKKSAGFTIHYIDPGVDTGHIIQAQRLENPFQFKSIWDLKAHTYFWEFGFYLKFSKDLLENPNTSPVGIATREGERGQNFRMQDFTLSKQQEAEAGYLWMQRLAHRNP